MGGHNGATWRIRLNRPSLAAMLPYVKLLRPLVMLIIITTCSIFVETRDKYADQ